MVKTGFHIVILVFCVFFAKHAGAQVNIAPQAKMGTNVLSSISFAPDKLNDSIIANCPNNEAWFVANNSTVGEYLEWDWGATVTINSMVIHHGDLNTRYLSGGELVYWNGQNWVAFYSFDSLPINQCVSKHFFNSVSSDKIRLVNWTIDADGSLPHPQYSNPTFREIEIFNVDADLSLESISLSTLNCSGSNVDLKVRVKNNGPEKIEFVRIEYGFENEAVNAKEFKCNLLLGKDTLVSLPNCFTNITGIQRRLIVNNGLHDLDSSNNLKDTSIQILQAVSGVAVTKFPGFNFLYNDGIKQNPDIAKKSDTLGYIFSPPKGYNNTQYGTAWEIEINPITSSGIPVLTKQRVDPPFGSLDGSFFVVLPNQLVDSLINVQVVIKNLQNNCDSVLNRYVYVAPRPLPNFNVTKTCFKDPTQFLNRSSIEKGQMSFFWDFGDGSTSDLQSPTHIYADTGYFTVSLTVISDWGIRKDTAITIEIFPTPNANFSFQNACEEVPVLFKNTTQWSHGKLITEWNLGDGNKNSGNEIGYVYSAPGIYQVKLTAESDKGCKASATKNVVQFARPNAKFTVEGNCSNAPLVFTNTSTIAFNEKIGTVWDFGDGETGTGLIANHKYANPGLRHIRMIALSQFDCRDTLVVSHNVLPGPEVNFNWDNGCSETPVQFVNQTLTHGAIVDYKWGFGDGQESDIKNPSHLYPENGKYEVTLKVQALNGCAQELTKEIMILPEPMVDFDFNDVCSGEFVQFVNKSTAEFGALTYQWSFGDGQFSNLTSPIHKYTHNGGATYDVTLEAKQPGSSCKGIKSKPIQVYKSPNCSFEWEIDKSDRQKLSLKPLDTSYASYNWVVQGAGLTDDRVSPQLYLPFPDKSYNVILTINSKDGCQCEERQVISTTWKSSIYGNGVPSIIISPNPVNNQLKMQGVSQVDLLWVTNIAGQRIEVPYKNGNDGVSIRMGALNSGVYFIHLSVNGYVYKPLKVLKN